MLHAVTLAGRDALSASLRLIHAVRQPSDEISKRVVTITDLEDDSPLAGVGGSIITACERLDPGAPEAGQM